MLSLQDLSFERQYRYLFRQLNTEVNSGELLQITGANGSGKSTLLRMIAGYIEIQEGQILWQNQTIPELHYIGHQNGIKAYLTVEENLELISALINTSKNNISLAMDEVGLKRFKNSLAQKLSAGQLRRLALARLLLKSSPLWILDEPGTALDTQGQEWLVNLIKQHLAHKGVVIAATHQPYSFGKILCL